jgi:hypothetical protein
MNLSTVLVVAALFVALTPGVLLTLPKGGKKITVAVVHGVVFAIVLCLVNKYVSRVSLEGFQWKVFVPPPKLPIAELEQMAKHGETPPGGWPWLNMRNWTHKVNWTTTKQYTNIIYDDADIIARMESSKPKPPAIGWPWLQPGFVKRFQPVGYDPAKHGFGYNPSIHVYT